jgi:hypothetical protein
VQLDGDDAGAHSEKRLRDDAVARPDIDNEITGPDVRRLDEPLRPRAIELVPPPPLDSRGHGTPSP